MLRKGLFFTLAFIAMLMFSMQAMAGGVIKIGVQAPITGKFASEGQSIDKAVRLIVKQYNEKGGILGKKLEVVTCDDEGKAVKAAICARNLVDKGVIAVIGSYTSTCAEAAEPIYYRAGVLQTSDGTSDTLVKHGYWTFFRNSSPNSAEAGFTARFLLKKQHYKRIALISDYSIFSTNITGGVASNIKKMGGNIVYYGKIISGSQNFTPILTKIKSYHPNAIYFGGMYPDGGLLRAQMIQLGINASFIGGDANDNPEFLELAGKAAVGAYLVDVPLPSLLPYNIAKKFLKAFKATYNENPASIWTMCNTDGLRVILYAIEQTKSFDTKKIAYYLHNKLKDFPGITGPISFAPNGERVGSAYMAYRIGKDLKYHIVYKEK